jgi:hypothetical protein
MNEIDARRLFDDRIASLDDINKMDWTYIIKRKDT